MAEIENLKIGNGGTLHIVGNEDIVANSWQAGKTYVKNKSYVIREHRLYVCNVTHTSVEPFDATKWTEITIGDAIGNNIGDLTTLTTSVKSSVVGAVNEVNGKVTVIDVIPNITMLNNYTLANSRLIKVGQMLVGILEISRSTAFVNNQAMATLPYYDSNFNIIIPSFCSTTDRWNAITPCNVFINNSNGNLIYAGANSNVKFVRVPIAIALP